MSAIRTSLVTLGSLGAGLLKPKLGLDALTSGNIRDDRSACDRG